MNKTKYLNLNRPNYKDMADVEYLNLNANILDEKIKDMDNVIKNNKTDVDDKIKDINNAVVKNQSTIDNKIKNIDNAIKDNKANIEKKEITWQALKNKPSTFNPSAHTHDEYANKNQIPKNLSQLTNNCGFIKGVSWNQVKSKPSSFNPSTHTHPNYVSKTGGSMTGNLTVPRLNSNEVYVKGQKQPKITVSTTKPQSPAQNDIWIDIS